jgi:membrane protease YdiL (CAAX protease family)
VSDPPEPTLGRPHGRKSASYFREAALGRHGARGPLLAALVTTLLATALSYALPEAHAATGVGLVFLGVTYVLVLRDGDTRSVREFGLSLGGLFEPEPLSASRLGRAALSALGWAVAAALLIFPAFWLGFLFWHAPATGFSAAPWRPLVGDLPGQMLGVAFPEEAFFRGYLQSALDRAWPPRLRVLGARLGPGLVVASAIFALGHLLTDPHPARLAVFFPSLAFGFLRARSSGIGAPILFHAACNLFASYLGRGYGLHP